MANTHPYCMGCMNPLPEGRAECGICGYPVDKQNPPLYLPAGHCAFRPVSGRTRALRRGGDLAEYIGWDPGVKARPQ